LTFASRISLFVAVYSYEADPPNGVYVDPLNGAMLTPPNY
jgi:hypothetical protein